MNSVFKICVECGKACLEYTRGGGRRVGLFQLEWSGEATPKRGHWRWDL